MPPTTALTTTPVRIHALSNIQTNFLILMVAIALEAETAYHPLAPHLSALLTAPPPPLLWDTTANVRPMGTVFLATVIMTDIATVLAL